GEAGASDLFHARARLLAHIHLFRGDHGGGDKDWRGRRIPSRRGVRRPARTVPYRISDRDLRYSDPRQGVPTRLPRTGGLRALAANPEEGETRLRTPDVVGVLPGSPKLPLTKAAECALASLEALRRG